MARFAQTTIECEVERVTEKAILIVYEGEEYWVPRSVCLDGNEAAEGDTDLIVADWWLEKEGLL